MFSLARLGMRLSSQGNPKRGGWRSSTAPSPPFEPVDDGSVTVNPDLTWTLNKPGAGGIEADLVMAADPIDSRYDRTIVTVRSSARPFSFAAEEVARGDRILVDDLGVLVTNADDQISLDAYREALRREFGGQTVYDRVAAAQEQTLSHAWNDMPLKRPWNFAHGLPGNRNTMRQWPNGEVEVTAVKRWFDVQPSPRDSERKLWSGEMLRISCGFPAEGRGGRELQEGYLPVLRTWWQKRTRVLRAEDGPDGGGQGLERCGAGYADRCC